MKIRNIIFVVATFLFLVVGAFASGEPTQAVKVVVDEVVEILRDPALAGPANKMTKADKITDSISKVFDWIELSRRSLGPTWRDMTPDQRREFVGLYTKLLEKTYADRIDEYHDQDVQFSGEESLAENKVEVSSVVTGSSKQIPINYRMLLTKDGQWKVYDVVIEGVSLVQNYRSQFNEIMAGGTPETLLAKLRDKVKNM